MFSQWISNQPRLAPRLEDGSLVLFGSNPFCMRQGHFSIKFLKKFVSPNKDLSKYFQYFWPCRNFFFFLLDLETDVNVIYQFPIWRARIRYAVATKQWLKLTQKEHKTSSGEVIRHFKTYVNQIVGLAHKAKKKWMVVLHH